MQGKAGQVLKQETGKLPDLQILLFFLPLSIACISFWTSAFFSL
jgi:hypothetical protein